MVIEPFLDITEELQDAMLLDSDSDSDSDTFVMDLHYANRTTPRVWLRSVMVKGSGSP